MSDQNVNQQQTPPFGANRRQQQFSSNFMNSVNGNDENVFFGSVSPPQALYSNWSTPQNCRLPQQENFNYQQQDMRYVPAGNHWPMAYSGTVLSNMYVNPSNYTRLIRPPNEASYSPTIAPPNVNEWDSFYTPFGMVRAPPSGSSGGGNQRTASVGSYVANSDGNSNIEINKGDISVTETSVTPKGVSYRDVALKPPLPSNSRQPGGVNVDSSSPPLYRRKEDFNQSAASSAARLRKHSLPNVQASRQSSSDSLSENGGNFKSPVVRRSVNNDSDDSESEKSFSNAPIKGRLGSSSVRKLENILRKDDDHRTSSANAFKKHANIATMTTGVVTAATVGHVTPAAVVRNVESGDFQKIVRRKGAKISSESANVGVTNSNQENAPGRLGASNTAKKTAAPPSGNNNSVNNNVNIGRQKLNNEESAKMMMSKTGSHKSTASYIIQNDLKSGNLEPVADNDRDDVTTSGDEYDGEDFLANSGFENSNFGSSSLAKNVNVNKSLATKSAAGNSGRKTSKRADSDLADRYGKRKKKRENPIHAWFAYVFLVVAQNVQNALMWLVNLVTDIGHQLSDVVIHCAKLCCCKINESASQAWYKTCENCRNVFLKIRHKEWCLLFWWRNRKKRSVEEFGLEKNIDLPNTGEEAMKRLLLCQGQDAYSILGLKPDCTDEDIKRYYRRQAVLVHPDKNTSYCADEAFKILAAAFELIGTPEHRIRYDLENLHRTKAMKEMEEMFAKLREKMEEVRSTMHCDCGKKHKRFPTERCLSSARFCHKCKESHAAREGDIWAESRWFGFLWYYYACMEGIIYDITEWAGCRKNNLKHIKPNAHLIQYRLITGRNNRRSPPADGKGLSDADAEEILNRLLEEKLNSAASSSQFRPDLGQNFSNATAPPQSKFRPPSCPGDSRPRKAGRRRNKARS